MDTNDGQFAGIRKHSIAGMMVAALFAAAGGPQRGYGSSRSADGKQAVTEQSQFYCDIHALTAEARAHHKRIGDKLNAKRKKIVELEKGYEFQYSLSDVSLAEMADWVRAEAKCCPFFDFHIDLENQGTLLCLRLTGVEGIKQFIRTEFHVAGK